MNTDQIYREFFCNFCSRSDKFIRDFVCKFEGDYNFFCELFFGLILIKGISFLKLKIISILW